MISETPSIQFFGTLLAEQFAVPYLKKIVLHFGTIWVYDRLATPNDSVFEKVVNFLKLLLWVQFGCRHHGTKVQDRRLGRIASALRGVMDVVDSILPHGHTCPATVGCRVELIMGILLHGILKPLDGVPDHLSALSVHDLKLCFRFKSSQ